MNLENLIKTELASAKFEIHELLQSNITNIDANNDGTITIICEDNKKIVAHYQVLGTYNKSSMIFYWAWHYKFVDNAKTQSAKLIKNYIKTLKQNIINNAYTDINYVEKLYYYLSNPLVVIGDNKLVDIYLIVAYITKLGVISSPANDDNIVLYLIEDIVKL